MTVGSTLANSNLHATSQSPGGAAAQTASARKLHKYADSSIPTEYIFQPVAFKTRGSLYASSFDFLREFGCRLTASDDDPDL